MASVRDVLTAAIAHQQGGRPDIAARLYRAVLAEHPGDPDALHLLGLLSGAAGLVLIQRAGWAQPLHAPALINLANRLRDAGRPAAAGVAGRRAVVARPDLAMAYYNLALAGAASGERALAERVLRRCLVLQPDNPPAWLMLGNVVRGGDGQEGAGGGGRDAVAAAAYRTALRQAPDLAAAHSNLAIVLRDLGDGDGAIRRHRCALALDPGNAGFHLNAGVGLRDLGILDAAVTAFDRSLSLRPDDANVRFNRAHALLLAGDFRRGLADYEARWRMDVARPAPGHPVWSHPLWDGSPPAGRTILLHTEQGLGDTLNFIRYAPLLAARGARLILEVERPLVRLLATLPGLARIVVKGEEALPPFDLHMPLASLPHAFATTLETIPAAIPYLRADPALAADWARRLAVAGASRVGAPRVGPGVGVVWAGNPAFVADRFRSPRFDALRPLLEVPGVRFFGLQLGDGRRDLEGRVLPASFTDLGPALGDFMDTAAVMANLDLIVSSCTAPAHLAGALGRPVWVLQPFAPDWRWMLGREDCPWYPTMRLFRQDRWDCWEPVVRRLVTALRQRFA